MGALMCMTYSRGRFVDPIPVSFSVTVGRPQGGLLAGCCHWDRQRLLRCPAGMPKQP